MGPGLDVWIAVMKYAQSLRVLQNQCQEELDVSLEPWAVAADEMTRWELCISCSQGRADRRGRERGLGFFFIIFSPFSVVSKLSPKIALIASSFE